MTPHAMRWRSFHPPTVSPRFETISTRRSRVLAIEYSEVDLRGEFRREGGGASCRQPARRKGYEWICREASNYEQKHQVLQKYTTRRAVLSTGLLPNARNAAIQSRLLCLCRHAAITRGYLNPETPQKGGIPAQLGRDDRVSKHTICADTTARSRGER